MFLIRFADYIIIFSWHIDINLPDWRKMHSWQPSLELTMCLCVICIWPSVNGLSGIQGWNYVQQKYLLMNPNAYQTQKEWLIAHFSVPDRRARWSSVHTVQMLHPLGPLPKHIHLFLGRWWRSCCPCSLSCRGSLHPLPARSRLKCQLGPTWEKPTLWHLTGQRQCHARPESLTPDENTMACSLPADAGRYR